MSDTTIAAPAPGKEPSRTKRNIVLGMIIILLLMLMFLFYYYLTMLKPKLNVNKPKLKDYEWIRSIYGISEEDKLNRPHDIAVDSSGNFYVADSGNARILKFDNNGNYIRSIGKRIKSGADIKGAESNDVLLNPLGVTVDKATGDIYATDRNLHKVIVYDKDGNYKKNWLVMMPTIPRFVDNKIYLATYGPFYIYDKNGKVLSKWGKRGRKANEFDFPNGIEVDKKGVIYIADSNNNQIKALEKEGNIRYVLGSRRTKTVDTGVKFDMLQGLTFDDAGLLYSVDAFSFVIRVFANADKKPEEVGVFGSDGTSDGSFIYPSGIAYLGNRRFAIADEGNNRVQILSIPLNNKMAKAAEVQPASLKSDLKGATGPVASVSSLLDKILRFLGLR